MKKALLYGGFDGWLNFGDFLQLRGILNFYLKKGFKPYILLNKYSLQSPLHLEVLKSAFGDNLIFYDKGCFLDSNLEKISELEIEIFHLYGGGFLNSYWGKIKLELIEKALNFFKPKRYFITGQQVSKEFLLYFKKHLEHFKPEIFGVRDTLSLKHCEEEGINAEFSFDDSTEYILEIREKIKKGFFDKFSLKDESLFQRRVLFLHLNFSYYALSEEGEIWSYRDKLKSFLCSAEELILVKSYQSYSIEVKDTLRAVDYIFLTREKSSGKFLDLSSFSLKENWEELGGSFPEIFSENALSLSNSYHTALFFTFLGVPSFLIKLNPYYEQKGCEIWEATFPQSPFEDLLELRKKQEETLSKLLKKREEFMEKFSALLEREPEEKRDFKEEFFTFSEVPGYQQKRVECDSLVRNLESELNYHKEEELKLRDYIKNLENELLKLQRKIEELDKELEVLKEEKERYREQLERIYRSRGWKVLSFYYKIKHWTFCKLGIIKVK